MAEPRDLVNELVEDTLAGYEDVLSPSALGQLRALLADSFAAHEVLRGLAAEQAPRAAPERSDELPAGEAHVEELLRQAKKDHG